jgi:serine/threonine protein kinase
VREIGKGGFGVVYLARDMKRRRRLVAVKQINIGKLSARESIDATDSYNREVTLLSKLRHRRLPRLYDHFTDPEHWYLVLSYIEGQTLDVYLQQQGRPLPLQKVIDIGMQVCDVLNYLHNQQPPIIFRDVKPANIMQTPRGHIYLIDFGIARQFSPARIKDTGPLGSPGYAAPEQYGRTQTTIQTDIYGLGATLQTLATGKEPLELQGDEPFPGLNSRLRQRFQHLVDQMLERESHKRPRSVLEVKARLEALKFGMFGSLRHLFLGFLLGSIPLALFLLQNILMASSDIRVCLLGVLMPFLLVGLFIVAMLLLFLSRERLVGLGIVLGLAIFLLIVLTEGRLFGPLF